MTPKAQRLTETPVNKMLIQMALPITLGMMSTFLFQIVDTYFVGQLGPEELAALAFSSSVYFLVVSIFIGLSIGVSAVVAKSVGAGLFEQAKLQTMVALLMVLGLSVTLGAVGFATIRPAFTILGAGPEIVPLIES